MSYNDKIEYPSICIPRVFDTIDEHRIRRVFERLDFGIIKRVDIVHRKNEQGEHYKRVFIHFERWYQNRDAREARDRLIEGKEVKVVYDNPWFWKLSINRHVEEDRRQEDRRDYRRDDRRQEDRRDYRRDDSRERRRREDSRERRRDDSRERKDYREDRRDYRRDDSRERRNDVRRHDSRERYNERREYNGDRRAVNRTHDSNAYSRTSRRDDSRDMPRRSYRDHIDREMEENSLFRKAERDLDDMLSRNHRNQKDEKQRRQREAEREESFEEGEVEEEQTTKISVDYSKIKVGKGPRFTVTNTEEKPKVTEKPKAKDFMTEEEAEAQVSDEIDEMYAEALRA